jgi:hypothetical protein
VISISHLCARQRGGAQRADEEFAAYYDLLHKPQHVCDRKIPFTMSTPTEGARADCTGMAKVMWSESVV